MHRIIKTKSRARETDAALIIFCHFEQNEKSHRVLREILRFTQDDKSAFLLLNHNLFTVYDIDTRSGRCIDAATEEVEDTLYDRSSNLDILNS